MKQNRSYSLAAAALAAGCLAAPAGAQNSGKANIGINSQGNAERCSDLKVTSKGEIVQANEAFTLAKNEAPVLELTGMDRGVLNIRGWDRAEYSVEACKVAAAVDRAGAEQTLRGISVMRSAGHFSAAGPSGDQATWEVFFFVHAPRDASLDLETKNGPISVAGINGTVKVRATNGPVSVKDSLGTVEVHTVNGPIAFNGGGGEVRLTAKNGPISLNLAGEMWNGSKLEARTENGPVSVKMPAAFRSGVRLETGGNGPISCRAGACQSAWRDSAAQPRVLQLNGSQDTIRVSTNNGPVSVSDASSSTKWVQ